jgi:hypothetical protein
MAKLAKDFLRDLTAFDITDGAIENVLIDAGIPENATWEELTVKQKDLGKAYTYLWCASTPSITGSVEDSDSGWSHREGGKQSSAYDKRLMRQMGLDLLAKYGLDAAKSTIHIAAGGMKVFPRRK